MKIIDLQLYRNKRAIEQLEQQIGQLAISPRTGSVRQLKFCFSEWLKKTGTNKI